MPKKGLVAFSQAPAVCMLDMHKAFADCIVASIARGHLARFGPPPKITYRDVFA